MIRYFGITFWTILIVIGFYTLKSDILWPSYLLGAISLLIMLINFVLRSSLKYKSYFIKKNNFLTTNYKNIIEIEIPKELMYEKVLEVLTITKLKVIDGNSVSFEILAKVKLSFWSWGENIYFEIIDTTKGSNVQIISSTIFGISAWGKNRKNFNLIVEELEDSLTI